MTVKSISLKELAKKLKVEFSGNGDLQITHVCGLDSLQNGGLAYLTSPDGLASVPVPAGMSRHEGISVDEINSSQVALIVSPGVKHDEHNLIFSEDPLATHVEAAKLLHSVTPTIPDLSNKKGIHSSAVVSKGVKLGKNVKVGPKSVIYEGVKIGDNTTLHAGVVIMSEVVIGSDCTFYPNVVVQDRCKIGNRVIIQSGTVIGSDGHGYFQREGVNHKIPQLGIVCIEDDVEIGACTTIDRARFHTTVIKQGSKLDNQVQIAHNVSVGEQALISFSLTNEAVVSVDIFDFSSRKVRSLAQNTVFSGGSSHHVPWDGRDSEGRNVANGTYFFRIQLESGPISFGKVVVLD